MTPRKSKQVKAPFQIMWLWLLKVGKAQGYCRAMSIQKNEPDWTPEFFDDNEGGWHRYEIRQLPPSTTTRKGK